MGNTDKEKKKKSAKHQSATAAKATPRRARKLTCKMILTVLMKEEVEMIEKTEEMFFKRISSQSFAHNTKLTSYLPLTIKSWKDVALSEALISAITNDPMIKQALFLSPGSNVEWGSSGTLLLRLTDGKGQARMDWLTADKQTKRDSKDSGTLQGTPDTRGVSLAHYYNVSRSKGGGKPKTDFHWQLCQILFTDHETYGLALRKAEECTIVKKRAAWKRT